MARFSPEELAQPKHFGWMRPSKDGPPKIDFAVSAKAFDSETLVEFDEITSFYGDIRPTVIDFLAFREEAENIRHLPQDIARLYEASPYPSLETGLRVIEMHVLVERRLGAFLSAASTLRDRLLSRYSADARKHEGLKKFMSWLYDRSAHYRLCYNLRNYAQHHKSPIDIIPIKGSGEDGNLKFDVELVLMRDRLVQHGKRLQPKVRAELGNWPEKIDLVTLCERYKSDVEALFSFLMFIHKEKFLLALHYEPAVRSLPDMPEGATPVLFHGIPTGDVSEQMNCKITTFSFDELTLLKAMLVGPASDADLPSAFAICYPEVNRQGVAL